MSDIRVIMCQPAIKRFQWELEVSITRLHKIGVRDIVLLFTKKDPSVPSYLKNKYGVEIHCYDDKRRDRNYIPSVKPYLWAKFLQEDRTRENETYLYIDSDVLVNSIPNVKSTTDTWYASDCESYLGIEYIESKGLDILKRMSMIVGIDYEFLKEENPYGGAQWIITHPTYEYWLKVYNDSIRLYRYLNSVPNTDIQKWTAEMWAQLWNTYLFNKTVVADHSEMKFTWATDPITYYDKTNFYHNAGVVNDKQGLFFKGKYITNTPFEDDLDFVDPTKASLRYVEAIREVVV